MFCPDCGYESNDKPDFCEICGYPVGALLSKLREEKLSGIGWAQRIIGVPKKEPEIIIEEKPVSFVTGESFEEIRKKDAEETKCERCGAKAVVGSICESCGDKLPGLIDNDPYLSLITRGFWSLVFSPRQFAVNLPYPYKSGLIQPTLWPAVFGSIFVFTYPIERISIWYGRHEQFEPVWSVIIFYAVLALLAIPVLVYLSAGVMHVLGKLLGGKCQFKRTVRITGAIILHLFLIGSIFHIIRYFSYIWGFEPIMNLVYRSWKYTLTGLESDINWGMLVTITIIIPGWHAGWIIAGLYRVNWWKAILITLIGYYGILFWVWSWAYIAIPLKYGGLL